jgi:nicotinate phosphoribosyltransferase
MTPPSTALLTDHYELTMLDAALGSGMAEQAVTFEVFARRMPDGRTHGVFCGLGRLLDALREFVWGPDELAWLAEREIVSPATLSWLGRHRFSGDIHAYREGELYTGGSPVLTVIGTFGESVVLETLVLSILNHDSAVAAAGERIIAAAGGRPVIEMGSRRTDPEAAVAAARAAWITGFASTSNLEAGRRYGIPTAGTSAHAFTLLYHDERDAFAAQVAALGPGTTLLVDTLDTERGIRHAVEAAGPGLGGIRIDSGDLPEETRRARKLLDQLGATDTRIVVTGDIDERSLAALADTPADGYGVGTTVVTGAGAPTAGFVYKLVEAAASSEPGAPQHPVAKLSPGKPTIGGRKWAWRLLEGGRAVGEVVAFDPTPPDGSARPLQVQVMAGGHTVHRPLLDEVRGHHESVRAELPPGAELPLHQRDQQDQRATQS